MLHLSLRDTWYVWFCTKLARTIWMILILYQNFFLFSSSYI
jgi:hypothetical protein